MVNTFLYANNAKTTLAGAITNVAVTANLTSGSGVLFPNPGTGQQFAMTFVDAATGLLNEIVYVTARSGDTITMIRGQEGTTALAWSAGDIAASLVTAGNMAATAQQTAVDLEVQAQTGNFAAATMPSANNYVAVYDPPITAHVIGMPLRFTVPTQNVSGAICTFNPGPGALQMNRGLSSKWFDGDLLPARAYTAIYNGSGYICTDLISASIVGAGPVPAINIAADGNFHEIFNINTYSSGGQAFALVNAGQAAGSKSWSGMILAEQFASGTGAGNTPPSNVTVQNSPGSVTFQVVAQSVQIAITGGGTYVVTSKILSL